MNASQNKKLSGKFLKSAQSRIFLAIMLVIFVAAGIGGFFYYRHKAALNVGAAVVSGGPDIQSTPGAGDPSSAYVQAQTKANIEGEISARKKATSFVPTITRPEFAGDATQFETPSTPSTEEHKICKIKQVVLAYKPNPESCTPKNLALARRTGVTAEELLCQGCSCPALKVAGYTAGDLKRIGLSAEQLKTCGYSLQSLIRAGFNAADLKRAGYTASQLAAQGFTPEELANAGFSPSELGKAYSKTALAQAGLLNAEGEPICSVAQIKAMKAEGESAADIHKAGCGLAALKAAGYTAAELKKAGFNAAQLKAAGYSTADLKKAGFSAADLKNAGFSAQALKDAGYSKDALEKAGYSPAEIKAVEDASEKCSVARLKQERADGASATALRQQGCGLAALKAAGYSAGALRAAGFSAKQLKDAGFTAAQLRGAGFSAAALKNAGFSASQLKNAGFSASQLKNAGFSAGDLKDAGFSAADLKNAGFSAAQLKNAGYSAGALRNAGFSADALKNAGYSAGQLASAGFGAKALKDAGFSANQLRDAGLTASQLRDAGFSPSALKQAGFSDGDLLRAGFSPAESGYAEAEPKKSAPVKQKAPSTTAAQQPSEQADAMQSQPALPSVEDNTMQGKLAQFQKQEQSELDAQQRENRIQQMQGLMTNQAQKLMTAWSNFGSQQFVKASTDANNSKDAEQNNAAGKQGADKNDDGPVIKAGTVLFAVLDTSINSDENSPIMAHVVSGKLKGSRLLGKFSRVDKRVMINFTLMGNPAYRKSIAINAVAIDPDTARTAISGDVNNHYLLRYGTLFASSFLEGVSNAIANQGVSTDCAGGGGLFCVVKTSPLNTDQQIAVGLGKVGQAYAQHMGENFNLPPTIRIPAGAGLGVLIMSDLVLPEKMDAVIQ